MTPQEKELLTRFLQLLAGAQAGQKDAEADALIREVVAKQPDASYLLVQRTMQLEQLLQASQAEVQKLKSEASQSGAGTSGGFLGDPNAWGRSAAAPAAQTSVTGRPLAAAPVAAAAPAAGGGWGGGLFGTIATTAAGVVAGSFLYQGIQGLMHRDEHHADAAQPHTQEPLASNEPELLNSYDTPDAGGDTFAADDSGGDFA